MNYRHAFHAGNFADLVKHAGLLALLAELTVDPAPLTVIDTHAGRGVYDLTGAEATRSGEAEAGIARLMAARDAPTVFEPLKGAVRALNAGKPPTRYPGSPWLIARALRPQDRYVACELQPEEHLALKAALKGRANVRLLCADGFDAAVREAPTFGRVLVLIDPPFEQPDDYDRIVETVADLQRRNTVTQALIWLPIKDLETFDAFLRDLEETARGVILTAEARMRPLIDPLKMNGCALVLVNGPDVSGPFAAICGWVAQTLGAGGGGRVHTVEP